MAKSRNSSVPLIRVGQLAQRCGKTVRTLRHYEELALLLPVSRTAGGFRLYDDSSMLRVQWIERLQGLGFSLSAIRDFLNGLHAHQHGPAAMEELRVFYQQKVEETRAALARLQQLEAELVSSIDYLTECRGCAPQTLRSSCSHCQSTIHGGAEPPAMVAAVHPM